MVSCYSTDAMREETVNKVSLSESLSICVRPQGSPGPAGPRGEKGEQVRSLILQTAPVFFDLHSAGSHSFVASTRDLKGFLDLQEKW